MTNTKNVILTVGNVYLDFNMFGVTTDHKDQLDAGHDYYASSHERVLGGSAINFAMQAKQLGAGVAFLGRVGEDADGRDIKRLLAEKGINQEMVAMVHGDTTSTAVNIVLSPKAQFIGIHSGDASKKLSPDQFNFQDPLMRQLSCVYFGGTSKQEHIFNALPQLCKQFTELGITTVVDPNRLPVGETGIGRETLLAAMPYIDFYMPNEEELRQVTLCETTDQALTVMQKTGVKTIVVKCGSSGCRIRSNELDVHIPGYHVTPMTTIGAGDSFNAGFITSYQAGGLIENAAKFGNAVAALKVSKNLFATVEQTQAFLTSAQHN